MSLHSSNGLMDQEGRTPTGLMREYNSCRILPDGREVTSYLTFNGANSGASLVPTSRKGPALRL